MTKNRPLWKPKRCIEAAFRHRLLAIARIIVVHEYGHVIDEFLTKNNAASSTVKNFSDYIFSDVCKMDGKSPDEIKSLLSRYANNDHAEFFAEAIAEALTSPHPRKTAS